MAREGQTNAYVAIEKLPGGKIRAYVGIGADHARAFGPHTPSVNEMLRRADAFHTARPFSSRKDAELAESLAIQALVKAGVEVANSAKTVSPSDVQPLLERKKGKVRYSQLRNALVVCVGPDKIGEGAEVRSGAVGFDPVKVAHRCDRYWAFGAATRRGYTVARLVAVLKATPGNPIVGCWSTFPMTQWDIDNGIVKLRDPARWDVGGGRGKSLDWEGRHPQKQQWSEDLAGQPGG